MESESNGEETREVEANLQNATQLLNSNVEKYKNTQLDAELPLTDSSSGSLSNKTTEDDNRNAASSGIEEPQVRDTDSETQTGTDDHDKPEDIKDFTLDQKKESKSEEEKGGVGPLADSLPDDAQTEKDESTQHHPSSGPSQSGPRTEIHEPECRKKVDEENVSEPEKKGVGPFGDSSLDNYEDESTQQTLCPGLQQSNQAQIGVSGNEKEISGPQIENNSWPKPESIKKVDEQNVIKSEKRKESTQQTLPPELDTNKVTDNSSETQPDDIKGADSSSGSSPDKKDNEFPPKIQSLEESKAAKDMNETSSEFSHTDEADEKMVEDKDQDQDFNEQKPEPILESLEHTTSSRLPQKGQPMIGMGGNDKLMWICAGVVILLSVVAGLYQQFSDSSPPVPKEFNVVDVFNKEMEKVKSSFPTQRPELWRRSLIHLRRHLKTEHPTEPVSLILTSGRGAERTLGCLAQCLARAFSTARNSSVLKINGKSKASQDSDQVKLDIDSELKKAFEGKTFAAVIHRFEELPPGSTLIFYRYCDHENAAYKNVFLAFTVMLDAEVEVPSNINLGRVEEMVQEHVKQKFVSSEKTATFNQMDVDKLSGLWSRISHLILPVAAEENIEQQGCGDCD